MNIQRAASLVLLSCLATPAVAGEPNTYSATQHGHPAGDALVRVDVDRPPTQGCAVPAGPGFLEPWAHPLETLQTDWLSHLRFSPSPPKETGLGFVARTDGVIVTSLDLVEGASRISVAFANGERRVGEVASVHTQSNTAIVRVPALGLQTLALATAPGPPGAAIHVLARCPPPCRENACKQASGVLGGSADAPGEPLMALLHQGNAPAPPEGALLLNDAGEIVGLDAQGVGPLLPFGGSLSWVQAMPVEAVRRLVEQQPPGQGALLSPVGLGCEWVAPFWSSPCERGPED